jgi:hypothetical protein
MSTRRGNRNSLFQSLYNTTDAQTLLWGPGLHPRFLAGTIDMFHVDLVLAINVTVHKHAFDHTATARTAHANAEMGIPSYRIRRADTSVEGCPVVVVVVVIIHQLQRWL